MVRSMKTKVHGTRLRRTAVVCFYVLVVGWGVLHALRPDETILWILFYAGFAFAATGWCVVDSRIIGSPVINSLHWIIFFTWNVAVPIYLIWSRGFRGLALLVLFWFACCVLCCASFAAAGYLAYGPDWLDVIAEHSRQP